jgi:anaerobic magnesium-protoporphyrin IX monomethyl ester cyclase
MCASLSKKDVQQAAMPAWDLIDLDGYTGDFSGYYNPKNLDFNMTPPIFTSRSCPFTCSFCSAHLIMGRKYEKKTPIQVVDEMEYLYAERGMRYFAFMDDVINISVKHVVGLCDEITRRNMNIHISINQGLYIALVEKEMVDALAAVGLATVSLPIEHGDENIRMSVLNKRLKDEQIHKVVGWIKPHDIFTVGLYIMGFPEETRETLNKCVKMMEDLQLDINATSSLIPFPRTDVHTQAVRDGLLLIDTDEVWDGKEYFDPGEKRGGFFIQPYNLSMDVLAEYRKIFNDMYFFSERAKNMNAPSSLVSTGETVAS